MNPVPENRISSKALTWESIFDPAEDPKRVYLPPVEWRSPVSFLVGRNGSGKSRTARALAAVLEAQYLSADRLTGLMAFDQYDWGPEARESKGLSLAEESKYYALEHAKEAGLASYQMYGLRDFPEVSIKVAAFVRRALGRTLEMRETSGFIDPYIRVGPQRYSLLRDEGHGLRELTTLLAATYRPDWSVLIVDEPELHLHPALLGLWMGELRRECERSDRRAIVVTHEPTLITPRSVADLDSYWFFQHGLAPVRVGDCTNPTQQGTLDHSLKSNQRLLAQLMFASRPVLVEGPTDAAALTTSLQRTKPPEVVQQTEMVPCGNSAGVTAWFEVALRLGLDVRAVADLDAMFSSEVPRLMDSLPAVTAAYGAELLAMPATTSTVLRPFYERLQKAEVAANPRGRAVWLANLAEGDGNAARKASLLDVWRRVGLYVHPQGTLEDVLGIQTKGVDAAVTAASVEGPIDAVADWCALSLEFSSTVEEMLNATVERIVHDLMEEQRLSPDIEFDGPASSSVIGAERLVSIRPLGKGTHRVSVQEPAEFVGYWLDFSRETPSSDLILRPPGDA